MDKLEQGQEQELRDLLSEAEEFHGHMGPFLVIGVRMGLIGLRELNAQRNDEKLHATAMLKYSVPLSCVIDGIQVAIKCTIGNKKLELKDSSEIAAKFELQDKGQIKVAVNPKTFSRLKGRLLAESVPPEETQKLVEIVASMPEEELFIIESK